MTWNFLNILSVKNKLKSWQNTLSFVILLLAFTCLYLCIQNFHTFSLNLNSFLAKRSAVQHLISASSRIEKSKTDVRLFFSNHLEKITLLSDLKHRHEQDNHPSWPISFNPNENALKHDFNHVKSKPFTHISAKLAKTALIDEEDLKQIFCLAEQKPIFPYRIVEDAPYIYFSNFELKKHSLEAFEKVYEINYVMESFHQ